MKQYLYYEIYEGDHLTFYSLDRAIKTGCRRIPITLFWSLLALYSGWGVGFKVLWKNKTTPSSIELFDRNVKLMVVKDEDLQRNQ